jgi:hypothetical protein
MEKNYQTTTHRAGTTGRTTPKKAKADPQRTIHEAALTLPEAVTVTVGELADELEEGLLAFAVGAGLKVLDVLLEEGASGFSVGKSVEQMFGLTGHGTVPRPPPGVEGAALRFTSLGDGLRPPSTPGLGCSWGHEGCDAGASHRRRVRGSSRGGIAEGAHVWAPDP